MDYKWTALTVTTIGTLMAGIDGRILIVGLPTIAQQLNAGPEEVIWITQAYLLSSTVCLLLIGRITDLFGRVKLYNIGFIIFTIGSLLCAISSTSLEVIAFRILQGIGSGVLVTNSAVIITDASPRNELGTMLGINQMAYRLGNMVGLTLSGLILAVVDWRGLFYINIPIGIFGAIWANRKLREIAERDPVKKMDWIGFISFSIGLTLLLLGITFLSYGFASYLEGGLLLLFGGAFMILFLKQESRISYPLLDLNLFKIKLFAMGNIAQMLTALAWGALVILLALYLQIGLGYSTLQAGLGIVPMDATYLVFTIVSGKLSDKYGSRLLTTIGLIIISTGFVMMSSFNETTSYLEFALVTSFMGVGNGFFNSPNLRAIMGSVPTNRIGVASAFRNTVFQIGLTVSFGLVILLLTLGIPYDSLSSLLQNAGNLTSFSLARVQFLNGFSITSITFAIVEAIAIIPSIMRGDSERTQLVSEVEG